ncbi:MULTISPECIES: TetR/AcrR family transcriptional regulator [unclassified Paenibacillus]|uniref:TetR/AcrR family transcriptional regulator n=1 Tax=unclassified Paenibacillus TaxID=185978 RepID=UPI002406B4F6|nr:MULTISPECIES: TetR/AcrR family transcriptional regulator [unclassified Paenibacillus]MDF9843794.1 AcrR family transcriptional regulator [Paenibacillus sp. PastF-2]MDF9850367.1 AcrR family transcriptional regulator [Paenibacillus sp. PastM-2]MDF9856930.1 AcrR family transcriptional regulator [Paenibacillus sp. PastF-1]MDH6482213.1 AcrR family transcriptional regulator [Paenibacillus sp. PastH-2]MDH6509623.1 AcrR family transcriptional regulator [Paenibacillus sp. PastM-3]
MKKQPEMTDKTRQTFINVFCNLYSQKPIEKITIQEIANQSGYNRSTFYQYFTDIYELLDYVEERVLKSINEEMASREFSAHTFQDALQCLENAEEISVFKALFGDYGYVHFVERLKREIPFERLIVDFPTNDVLAPYIIEFYISTLISIFRLWIRNGKDLSSEELVTLADSLLANGITPYHFFGTVNPRHPDSNK